MALVQNNLKVAIVHDWLYGGGAEKVIEALHNLYPDAPIYTSYCTPDWEKRLDNKVITGYLNKWPFTSIRKFLPLLRQWWFAGLNLSEYDFVIISTGNGEAKFVRPKDGAKVICYCHSPVHFYWGKYDAYMKNPGFGKLNFLAKIGLKLLVKPLRNRDYNAAQKIDHFIANSNHIKEDIAEFYNKDSEVIFPPINTNMFSKVDKKTLNKLSFIMWGRHVPDKRMDIAINACNQLKIPLTIIGRGPYTEELKKISGETVTFTGFIDDAELMQKAGSSSAFIFPSLEDFGIAPVEAMAAGLPVIAYKGGGALDYVIPGKTGEFFDDQSTESLIKVIEDFDPKKYDSKFIKKSVEKFSGDNFNSSWLAYVDKVENQ